MPAGASVLHFLARVLLRVLQLQLQCNYNSNSAANGLALQLELHRQSISTEIVLLTWPSPTTLAV